jgi:hypothetical protein
VVFLKRNRSLVELGVAGLQGRLYFSVDVCVFGLRGLLLYVGDEGVSQQLRGRHALGWLPLEALGDEAERVLGTVGQGSGQGDLGVLWEVDALLGGVLEPVGPVLQSGRADDRADLADLVHFAVALEERFLEVHFCNQAAQREDIDWSRVCREAKQQFWCAIPTRRDVLSERWLTAYFLGDTEVDDLHVPLLRNQDILWFEVAVEETVPVDAAQGLGDLTGDIAHLMFFETAALLLALVDELEQVAVDVLEDQVGVVDDAHQLLKLDDVGVRDLAQGLDFRQLQALLPRPVLLLQLLDRHYFLRLAVLRFLHIAEAALS